MKLDPFSSGVSECDQSVGVIAMKNHDTTIPEMKCLSIRQPWAFLVCVGAKKIENRTWDTKHRGLIAIHAGGYHKAVESYVANDTTKQIDPTLFSYGAIIGVVNLFDVVPYGQLGSDDEWAEGPYCLRFRDAQLFETPIPHKGRVNLCSLPSDVVEQVQDSLLTPVAVEGNERIARCVATIQPGPIDSTLLRPSFRPSRM